MLRQSKQRLQRGAMSIEFAFLAPLLFLLMIGSVELLLLSATQAALTFSLADAAREVRLSASSMDIQATVEDRMRRFSLLSADKLSVSVLARHDQPDQVATGNVTATDGRLIIYEVRYQFNSLTFFGPVWPDLQHRSRYLIQREGS